MNSASARECLERNILPLWLGLKDPRGGFYGEMDAHGNVLKDAPRGVILGSRIIWSFSAAYAALGKKEYLEAALHQSKWFLEYFCDSRFGGVYWSVAADGRPLETKK